MSKAGKETVLYSFAEGTDGAHPYWGVFQDAKGNLSMAATTHGGTRKGDCSPNGPNCGTVFKLNRDGKETVPYTFKGGSDGAHPAGSVIKDALGNLFGTTRYGGATQDGVVFKLTPQR